MSDEGHIANPPSKKRLGLIVGVSAAVAAVVVVGFVMPAEYQVDPTGFGKATGLLKLGTPVPKEEAVDASAASTSITRYYPTAYRSDIVDIPLAVSGDANRGDELEYKVRMKAGDSMVYSWSVPIANPEEFYYDFHGENPAGPGNPTAKVVEYKQSTGTSSNGVLVAPIPGVHGWFLQNQSEKAVVVRLRISGFYELVPPGEYGNDRGIKPAAEAAAK